jgi:hypothetical protein
MTADEVKKLKEVELAHGDKNWETIAALMAPGRTKIRRIKGDGVTVSNIDPTMARVRKSTSNFERTVPRI